MKKNFKHLLLLLSLVMLLTLPFFVFAGDPVPLQNLKTIGGDSGFSEETTSSSVFEIIGSIVNVLLSTLGIIFTILILYAGYNWMIAGGDESKIEKAKNTLTRAVIGLIIVVSSWAIWMFIAEYVLSGGQQ